jgi:hypothetical protein
MPSPREALTKAEPFKVGVSPLRKRKRTLRPKSQPIRNPTCLPSGQGAGQRGNRVARKAKKESRQAASVKVNEGSRLIQEIEQGIV